MSGILYPYTHQLQESSIRYRFYHHHLENLLLMLHLHLRHIYSLQRTCGLPELSLFRNRLLQEQQRKNAVGCWLNLLYSSLIGIMISQSRMDILWYFGIASIDMSRKIWIYPIRQGWHFSLLTLMGFLRRWVVNADLNIFTYHRPFYCYVLYA